MSKNVFAIIFLLFGIVWIELVHGAMTEAQVKAAGKVARNVCQPKNKITNEQIDNMHKGVWEEVEAVKCYMGCVTTMMKMMKQSKFQYDGVMKQIASLPEKMREPTKVVMEKCKDAIKANERCQAGFELGKCIYDANPEIYFLP